MATCQGESRLPPSDEALAEGQTGQVGAAAVTGLVPDPVQVRGNRADADMQLGGDLAVGAAPGDQGDQFPFPGAEAAGARCRRLRRAGVGEHQGVLGGGGQAHRRAAVLGRPRPAGSQRQPGLAQLVLPAGHVPGQIGGPLRRSTRRTRPTASGPRRSARSRRTGSRTGTGRSAGQTRCRSALRVGALPAGPLRRRWSGPLAGLGPRSRPGRPPGSTGRPRPGPGPGPPRRCARLRPDPGMG